MAENKLPKEKLDEMMRLTEEIFAPGAWNDDIDVKIHERTKKARSLPENGVDLYWMHYLDLVDVVHRMAQGDKYEALYKVLEVLGWQVTDDEPADH